MHVINRRVVAFEEFTELCIASSWTLLVILFSGVQLYEQIH